MTVFFISERGIFEMQLNCPVLNLIPRVSEFFFETTLLNLVIIPETLISFSEFNCICLSRSKIMSTNPSGRILDSIFCPLFVAIQMVSTIEFKFFDGMYTLKLNTSNLCQKNQSNLRVLVKVTLAIKHFLFSYWYHIRSVDRKTIIFVIQF